MVVKNVLIPIKDFNEFYKFIFDETLTCRFVNKISKFGESYSCQITYDYVDAGKIDKWLEMKSEQEVNNMKNKNKSFWSKIFSFFQKCFLLSKKLFNFIK